MWEMMFLSHPVSGQMHAIDTVHLFQQEPEIQLVFFNINHVLLTGNEKDFSLQASKFEVFV